MVFVSLKVFCILCGLFSSISGLAVWMTKEECKKPLRVGEMIMGSATILSDTREIRVYRNGNLVTSGDVYIPGEELLVVLHGENDAGIQFVFEASNAVFIGGGCDGHRLANLKASKLLTPSDTSTGALDVEIVAGWSAGYETVKITPTFVLIASNTRPLLHATEEENTKDNKSAAVEAAVVVKTNLRKKLEDSALPETLSADHKIKVKHASPSAYTRTHPQKVTLNSKLPVESGEATPVHVEASESGPKLLAPEAIPPDSPPALAEMKNAVPAPPASIKEHELLDKSAKKDDPPDMKDVLESMKELSDKVHDRAKHKAPHAPLKSPSKHARFSDSLHAGRPRHPEKKPVVLKVGDVKVTEKSKSDSEAAEAEEETLPGAHLSATEKRLRRSQRASNLFTDGTEQETGEHSAPIGTPTPVKTILAMLFTGVVVFTVVVLLVGVLMYLCGFKDELSRIVQRITRHKQGQDKE